MSKTNKEVVQGFFEEVINAKRIDRLYEYFSPESMWHTSSYVGVGVSSDDSTPGKVVVMAVAPGGPSDGKLQPGDRILRAEDEHQSWETYQQLRSGVWGQGVVGTKVTLQVLREGQVVDIVLTRGLVEGFDLPVAHFEEMFGQYLLKDWPDLKVKIDFLVAEDDLVAVYLTNSGTSAEYNRQAVWAECDIYRVRDGKIVEGWAVEDSYARMKQEGYLIQLPVI